MYFAKKWLRRLTNAATPQRQSQFTPKMKANAESRLLSSLVWIDHYNEYNWALWSQLTTLIIFWQNTLPANIRKWVFSWTKTWRNYKFAWNSCKDFVNIFTILHCCEWIDWMSDLILMCELELNLKITWNLCISFLIIVSSWFGSVYLTLFQVLKCFDELQVNLVKNLNKINVSARKLIRCSWNRFGLSIFGTCSVVLKLLLGFSSVWCWL